ncbi:MAG: gephyrin-like molybdotransferase Glp [Pseudomonadota bacterium]
MISVAEAEARVAQALQPTHLEWVPVDAAAGRTLARPLAATRTQPPADVSAMDGYAVRAAEVVVGRPLVVSGESAAGGRPAPPLAPGSCVRIFTGGLLPEGADAILIQENAERTGADVRPTEAVAAGRHVRTTGIDFRTGEVLLPQGCRLGARQVGLAASMGHGHVAVHRRPRIGIAATGDELVRPGAPITERQIPNSNVVAIAAAAAAFGGEPVDLGIVRDDPEDLLALTREIGGLDLLVTSGGASVGDHDLIRSVLGTAGLELDFWRIAMRPGKPLVFGRLQDVQLLGLPGNAVSTTICCLVFLRTALDRLCGRPGSPLPLRHAHMAVPMPANDQRQDFVRAQLEPLGDAAAPRVRPFSVQDSSMMSTLAHADALIVRPPFDPPRAIDDLVDIVRLNDVTGF